jgi:hypothetical protein
VQRPPCHAPTHTSHQNDIPSCLIKQTSCWTILLRYSSNLKHIIHTSPHPHPLTDTHLGGKESSSNHSQHRAATWIDLTFPASFLRTKSTHHALIAPSAKGATLACRARTHARTHTPRSRGTLTLFCRDLLTFVTVGVVDPGSISLHDRCRQRGSGPLPRSLQSCVPAGRIVRSSSSSASVVGGHIRSSRPTSLFLSLLLARSLTTTHRCHHRLLPRSPSQWLRNSSLRRSPLLHILPNTTHNHSRSNNIRAYLPSRA